MIDGLRSGGAQSQRAVLVVALAGAFASCACGGESRAPRPPARSSLLEEGIRTPSVASTEPGWRYHPSDAGALSARAVLANGDAVMSGQRGERWLVRARGEAAEAAAELAPEELVAIVPPRSERRSEEPQRGRWLFVGKSGTTYEADAPLGAFLRSAAPLEPLVRVRESHGVLVGVRRDGALARSDTSGATWAKVGPDDTRFEDVAIRSDGHGLALAIPEAVFETNDFGATWKRTALVPIGLSAFVQDESEGIVGETALGPRVWNPGAEPHFAPLGRPMSSRNYTLGVAPPPRP